MNEQEFTLYEKNGSVFSIGMEFKNLLREAGLPAMVGGGDKNHKKMKNHVGSHGIPIGLSLLNKQLLDSNVHDIHNTKVIEGGVVKDDLYNRLLQLAEDRKKTNAKTRKNLKGGKKKKRKTRKFR